MGLWNLQVIAFCIHLDCTQSPNPFRIGVVNKNVRSGNFQTQNLFLVVMQGAADVIQDQRFGTLPFLTSTCQINSDFYKEGTAIQTKRCWRVWLKHFREFSGFVVQLPQQQQPDVMSLTGVNTQSSSGHRPELDKLYCWHLDFLSSSCLLFSSSSSSFSSWLIEGWLSSIVSIIIKASAS